ncbi:MAG: DHH family phosphoesterase [Candidatus Nanoarchaeia archaeon]
MNPELLKQFDDFVNNLKGKTVGILFDSDADGMCSGVITAHAVERLGGDMKWCTTQTERGGAMGYDIIQKMHEEPVEILITCDKPIDQNPERVKEAEAMSKILCLDHHVVNNDIQSEKTLFIKAQLLIDLEGGSQYPTAKLAYDLFGRVIDVSQWDWIAAAGLIADASYRSWRDFVDGQLKKMNEPIPKDIFKSKIAKVSKLINNVLIFDSTLSNEIFKELKNAKSIDEFTSSNLTQYEQVVQDEMEYWLNNYKTAEFNEDLDLIWYEIKPKFRIGSPVSTILSMNTFPNKSVIVVQDLGKDNFSMSFRRQDRKVNMAELARSCTEGLEKANGGGHVPAAGGSVLKKDMPVFKERVLKYLREHKTS